MNRIASYVRVSTGRQRDKATIETQRQEIARFCKIANLPEPREFADDGVSSRVPFDQRLGSAALLKEAQTGRVDKVLVYRLDRLGRDAYSPDTQVAVHRLWRAGVKEIVSMKQGAIANNPNGRLMLTLHAGVAGYERASTIERSNDATRRLAQTTSRWLGGPAPFGYRVVGRGSDAHLEICPEEAASVRRMFKWSADGWSCRRIAKELNALGIAKRRGRDWWPEGVHRILANTLYRGEQVWGRRRVVWNDSGVAKFENQPETEWIRRPSPPIISPDLFARVAVALERIEAASRAHARHNYLLSGLIRCACCGRAFAGEASIGVDRDRLYYRCLGRYRVPSDEQRCQSPSLPAPALEGRVWDYVAGFLARPALAKKELEQKIAAEGSRGRSVADEIKQLETVLVKVQEGRRNLLRQVSLGNFTDEEISAEVKNNREREADILKRLDNLRRMRADQKTLQLKLDWCGRLLSELREKLATGDLSFEKKRQFIEALVEGITVETKDGRAQVRIKFRFDRDSERLKAFLERGKDLVSVMAMPCHIGDTARR